MALGQFVFNACSPIAMTTFVIPDRQRADYFILTNLSSAKVFTLFTSVFCHLPARYTVPKLSTETSLMQE
ncbi:MAG: hypothetical protein MZV64_08620 [Ignavibacteriales bacterium]|nr:hypothetical protein [Ignavibacteriales bacterium]